MIAASSLSAAAYLGGAIGAAVVTVVLAGAAVIARRAWLPAWSGARARVAEVTVFVAVLVGVAQILGSFGLLRRGPYAIGVIVVAIGLGLTGAASTRRHAAARGRARRGPREADAAPVIMEEGVALIAGGGLVVAQWVAHVGDALGRGMSHPDTLWYHAPYAAEMLRTGHTNDLLDRADTLQTYYPLNSSLVHTIVMLPFHRDFLSPFVNLAWLALAFGAAWSIGRRRGVAPLTTLGALVVFALPTLAATQPGQASNDVVVGALLLAGVALLLDADYAPFPMLLAGAACGLALGTKLTVLAPIGVLAIGVIVLALRARAVAGALTWLLGIVAFGSYWYLRNWVEAQNPLPWFHVRFGPLDLPQRVQQPGASFASRAGDTDAWRHLFVPGFWQALGRVWPLILALMILSAVLTTFGSRRVALERLIGVTIFVGIVAYAVTPTSGALNFTFNVRYLTPTLLLGFVFLAYAFEAATTAWRRVGWIGALVLLVIEATSPHRERVSAWPPAEQWLAIIAGLVVVAGAWAFVALRTRRIGASVVAFGVLVVAVGAVTVGWPMQRHFFEHRYVDAGLPTDRINAYFRDVHHANVVVYGSVEIYPMAGLDLTNRVRFGAGPSIDPHADPCRTWASVRRGDYNYVVFTQYGFVAPTHPPREWFTGDPAATEVAREGNSVVYRVNGPLHPAECAT